MMECLTPFLAHGLAGASAGERLKRHFHDDVDACFPLVGRHEAVVLLHPVVRILLAAAGGDQPPLVVARGSGMQDPRRLVVGEAVQAYASCLVDGSTFRA